jgi:hypothetical protein
VVGLPSWVLLDTLGLFFQVFLSRVGQEEMEERKPDARQNTGLSGIGEGMRD